MKSLKEGYKKTEIGLIPYEWDLKRISDVCSVKGGKRLPKGYQLIDEKNQNPYIRVADMYNGGVSLDNIKYVPSEAIDSIKNYKISKDDLFISVAGTLGLVGKVPESLDGANLTENADKLCNIKINKEFLMRILQSELIQKIIELEKTSNAQPKLALTRIKEFLIPIPSEKEQEKIADILSTVDSQIDDTDKLIEKTKELKKGLMKRLLTKGIRHTEFKKTEVGEIPVEWEVRQLEECINVQTGYPFKSSQFNVENIGLPLIRIRDIITSNISTFYNGEYSEEYIVKSGDILIGMDGEFNISIWRNKDGLLNQRICRITSKNNNEKYFYYVLQTILKRIELETPATTVKHLVIKDMLNRKVSVPSKHEQYRIESILSNLDNKILDYENKKIKLEELKKGLMQQLLTGKVRVF